MPAKGWRKPTVPCSIENCDRRSEKRGWCNPHYQNWRRSGDPIPRIISHYGSRTPRISPGGYRLLYDPEHPLVMSYGYVYEHRKVAWDLGIITSADQHVHHINHDRLDNRPENLSATTNSEHAHAHAVERGTVTNQFGTWPIRSSTR